MASDFAVRPGWVQIKPLARLYFFFCFRSLTQLQRALKAGNETPVSLTYLREGFCFVIHMPSRESKYSRAKNCFSNSKELFGVWVSVAGKEYLVRNEAKWKCFLLIFSSSSLFYFVNLIFPFARLRFASNFHSFQSLNTFFISSNLRPRRWGSNEFSNFSSFVRDWNRRRVEKGNRTQSLLLDYRSAVYTFHTIFPPFSYFVRSCCFDSGRNRHDVFWNYLSIFFFLHGKEWTIARSWARLKTFVFPFFHLRARERKLFWIFHDSFIEGCRWWIYGMTDGFADGVIYHDSYCQIKKIDFLVTS